MMERASPDIVASIAGQRTEGRYTQIGCALDGRSLGSFRSLRSRKLGEKSGKLNIEFYEAAEEDLLVEVALCLCRNTLRPSKNLRRNAHYGNTFSSELLFTSQFSIENPCVLS